MEIICTTCNGNKKEEVQMQDFNVRSGEWEKQPPYEIKCSRCKGEGKIDTDQLLLEAAQESCYCECESTYDWTYHHDDNDQIYGSGFTCPKHHWSCDNCGCIAQIG